MAFWLVYRLRRILIWLRNGACLGEYVFHCWHFQPCKIPNTTCFKARAENTMIDSYFYECCRCKKTSRKKRYSGYGCF